LTPKTKPNSAKTLSLRIDPKFYDQLQKEHPEGMSAYVRQLLAQDEEQRRQHLQEPPVQGYIKTRCPGCDKSFRLTVYCGDIEEA
jgi:hypothetical protein